MQVTVDKELQDAVALIYQRGFAKGLEAGIRINDVAGSEPEQSNELDPETLNMDERAIWDHGHMTGFDEAVTIYEGDDETGEINRDAEDDESDAAYEDGYDDGYEIGYDEGVRVTSLDIAKAENDAYNNGYDAGERDASDF